MNNKRESTREACYCPYCDAELAKLAFPYCETCEIEFTECPECSKPVPRQKDVCPYCGANIREESPKEG